MSYGGYNYNVPPGPLIPSDTLSSKSKSDLTYPYYKFILPSYAATSDVVNPAPGMMIFNTTTSKINFYTGSAWEVVTSA